MPAQDHFPPPRVLLRRLRHLPYSLTWHLLQYLLILAAVRLLSDSLPNVARDVQCRDEYKFCAENAINYTR